MGIARRKAGTVVRCPTCSGQVVVPHPISETAAQQSGTEFQAAGELFEEPDFDRMLEPVAKTPPPPNKALDTFDPSKGAVGIDVEPVSFATGDTIPNGSAFSAGKFILLTVIMLVLIGLAFLAGLLVGRTSVSP